MNDQAQHQHRSSDTALLTDRYEFSMLTAAIARGIADRKAVFETFARTLPHGRRYGLLAGLGRLLPLIEAFRFDADEIDWLLAEGVVNEATATYLRDFRFTGDISGLREGDLYFPNTPVLTVTGTYGECLLLETLILSVLNHDVAIASAAARMVTTARSSDRMTTLIEMGSRRTHEEAAVAAARAAYIAGFDCTSNLAAGRRHGIPTAGTAAHAWTLAFAGEGDFGDPTGEVAAFRAQIAAHGVDTTLLVDTYDIEQGIRHAVTAARQEQPGVNGPGTIRIDSGYLPTETAKARAILDDLGAVDTRIVVTSDLDEHAIFDLIDTASPVDSFGVGTRLVTGSGAPTAGFVYKLVEIEQADGSMRPVAKRAAHKASIGGRKTVYRVYGPGEENAIRPLVSEVHVVGDRAPLLDVPEGGYSALAQMALISRGEAVYREPIEETRATAYFSLASLPERALSIRDGEPYLTPQVAQPSAPVLVSA